MKGADSRSMMPVLRAWLDGDDSERNADLIAAFVIAKAMSGHFGFFKLVIDLVDGKLHPTAEDEMTFETDCAVVSYSELASAGNSVAA
jgi:hypothetical protein